MRSLLYVISAMIVLAMGFWAYRENYQTQDALREVSQLQRQIGQRREELAVLRAEWAYLNRPERLRELAELNYSRLRLKPLEPEQFGRVDQVSYPRPDAVVPAPVTDPIEVMSQDEANP